MEEDHTPNLKTETRQQIEKLLLDEEAQKKRTWAYYQDIKKKDPHKFLMPKLQVQMMKDAAALGESFKDGDYNAI